MYLLEIRRGRESTVGSNPTYSIFHILTQIANKINGLRKVPYGFHHIFSPHVLRLPEKIRHQVISALNFFYEAFLEMNNVKKNRNLCSCIY